VTHSLKHSRRHVLNAAESVFYELSVWLLLGFPFDAAYLLMSPVVQYERRSKPQPD